MLFPVSVAVAWCPDPDLARMERRRSRRGAFSGCNTYFALRTILVSDVAVVALVNYWRSWPDHQLLNVYFAPRGAKYFGPCFHQLRTCAFPVFPVFLVFPVLQWSARVFSVLSKPVISPYIYLGNRGFPGSGGFGSVL